MNELIWSKNADLSEYEELLMQRDKLRKEAYILKAKYMAEFGDLVTALFEKKIECIKKKKMLSYCQMSINKGEAINQNAMWKYLEAEMEEYNRTLRRMLAENEAAREMDCVSESSLTKIKRLYRKLAKMIHPDINPKTNEIPTLQSLWQMITVSYNANDLDALQEAEVLVNRALAENGLTAMEIEIADIAQRAEKVRDEIYKIKTTNPYQYKYLLSDADAVAEKKMELKKEIKEYCTYENELNGLIAQMMAGGMLFYDE